MRPHGSHGSPRSLPSHPARGCPPSTSGFLPFANSVDADEIGWLTRGAPDAWPLVVRPRHAPQGPPLTGALTGVLLDWLRGRFSAGGFAALDEDDDPLGFIGFEAWTDDASW